MSNVPESGNESARVIQETVKYVADRCGHYLASEADDDSLVTNFVDPHKLEAMLKEMHLSEQPVADSEVHECIKFIMEHSAKSGHKRCLNQLYHRADMWSVLGDWVTSTINSSIYTYEAAPIATLLENEVIAKYGKLVGWDADKVDGTMPPGGSYSNLYGLLLARTRMFPHVAEFGWKDADAPVVMCSIDSHYSVKKSAAMIGMGHDNVISVQVDSYDRMLVSDLKEKIAAAQAAGKKVFCVHATVGTTLTGAIDPLPEIAAVCKEHNIWMHADGCLGGALLHSPAARQTALKGIELADTVCVNPHKMLGATVQCAVFLTKHPDMMMKTFSTRAAYLFNADKDYNAAKYDVGDKVFQCGRRVDALKLWIMWKRRGDAGMQAYVERAIDNSRRFNQVLKAHYPHFVPMLPMPGFPTVGEKPDAELTSLVPCTCFWWIPKGPETPDASKLTRDELCEKIVVRNSALYDQIDAVAPKAKLAMMRNGYSILTMSRLQHFPNFWRMVTNGGVIWTVEEIEEFLSGVQDVCDDCLTAISNPSSPVSPCSQRPCCQ